MSLSGAPKPKNKCKNWLTCLYIMLWKFFCFILKFKVLKVLFKNECALICEYSYLSFSMHLLSLFCQLLRYFTSRIRLYFVPVVPSFLSPFRHLFQNSTDKILIKKRNFCFSLDFDLMALSGDAQCYFQQ